MVKFKRTYKREQGLVTYIYPPQNDTYPPIDLSTYPLIDL